jgi:hypothetical protein
MFNNRRRRFHTLLYSNMYRLKPSAASPNLYPTPTINLKSLSNTNSHRNSSDINHNPAMSSESSLRSAQLNRKVDCLMFEDARVLDALVLVLREVVVAMVDMPGAVVVDMDTSVNTNEGQLPELASPCIVKGAVLEVKEEAGMAVSMSSALIWDQAPT